MKQQQPPVPPLGSKDIPDDPALQGEGNYTAARRHRASVKKFVDAGKVEPAARDAAPDSDALANELEQAEDAGRSRTKR